MGELIRQYMDDLHRQDVQFLSIPIDTILDADCDAAWNRERVQSENRRRYQMAMKARREQERLTDLFLVRASRLLTRERMITIDEAERLVRKALHDWNGSERHLYNRLHTGEAVAQ